MDRFTVSFFGHRHIEHMLKIEKMLEEQVRNLVFEKEYVNFLVGRNGEFDWCVSSSIRRVRDEYRDDNSALILILPYATAEYRKNEESYHNYYTDVEISDEASKAHPKSAIQMRNREMVDRSDLVICYIEHENGGAWKSVKYAIECGKTVINLAEQFEFSD